MTMTISLPPEEEKILVERAAATGQDVSQYVHRLIKKDIELLSFSELFAPVHRAVNESGLTPVELDSLLENAIAESRANQKS